MQKMRVKHGLCQFCNSDEVVLFHEKLKEEIKNGFSIPENTDKLVDLEEFFLCTNCSYKVFLSSELKQNFNRLERKTRRLKQCLFCESRTKILLETKEDPGNFNHYFTEFAQTHSPSLIEDKKRLCELSEDGLVCLHCLFALNIWIELKSCIYNQFGLLNNNDQMGLTSKRRSIPSVKIQTSNMGVKQNRVSNTVIPSQSEDEVKTTTPGTSKTRSSNRYSNKTRNTRKLGNTNNSNEIIQTDLKKLLPLNQQKYTFDDRVKDDVKMYTQVPYVKLKKLNGALSIEKKLTPRKRLSPIITSLRSRLRGNHFCNVCDKWFVTKCEYLSHHLKHQQIDNLIVSVSKIDVKQYKSPRTGKKDDSIKEKVHNKKSFGFKINFNRKKLQLKGVYDDEDTNDDLIGFGQIALEGVKNVDAKIVPQATEFVEEQTKDEESDEVQTDPLEDQNRKELEENCIDEESPSKVDSKNNSHENDSSETNDDEPKQSNPVDESTKLIEKLSIEVDNEEKETDTSDVEECTPNQEPCEEMNTSEDAEVPTEDHSECATNKEDSIVILQQISLGFEPSGIERQENSNVDLNNSDSDVDSTETVQNDMVEDLSKETSDKPIADNGIDLTRVESPVEDAEISDEDGSDNKENSREYTETALLRDDHEESDEDAEENDCENVQTKPYPIMTNQDLLNILEENREDRFESRNEERKRTREDDSDDSYQGKRYYAEKEQ